MSEKLVELPTRVQFSEQMESIFRAKLDDGQTLDLHLVKVESKTSNAFQECFSLLFHAPLDAPPFQNMFCLEHDKLGVMDLFLVPVEKKDDCLVFEAVFNHLVGRLEDKHMRFCRRKFLATTTLAAGAVLPFGGVSLGQMTASDDVVAASGDPLSRLTWDSFYPYITTKFVFRDSKGSAVDLQLTEMADTSPKGFKATKRGEECFSLTFSGSARTPLVQDVYTVEHFALGSFSLLITVAGRTRKNSTYEAVINRIVG